MSWYNDLDDFKESAVPYVLILGTIVGAYAIGRGCSHTPSQISKTSEPKDVKNTTLEQVIEGKEKWAKFISEVIETQNDNAKDYPYVFKRIPLKPETVKIYVPGPSTPIPGPAPRPQPYPNPYPNQPEYGPQDVPENINPGTTY